MSTIALDLANLLLTVRRPGDFYTTGRSEMYAPNLEVSGVGPLSLPLLPVQAEQLIAVAEHAPYGRGADTLIDTDVRRTWQIAADRVRIGGRHWDESLAAIVARSASGLGVLEPVSAELYKMLVYDTGSFFVGHRDTEKAPGMFATLVIVLPSIYTGGDLLIRHQDREISLDLSCQDASEVAFAAFYADCRHEVRPITSGCRLALIYNLMRKSPGRAPEPPAYNTEEGMVSDLLCRWAVELETAGSDSPDKLIYPLEHAYTPAEIGFAGLKNADAAVAAVLVTAARRADCELHLAFLAIEESGGAEYAGSWSGRGRYADPEDDYEVGEIYERTLTLSNWQTPDGSRHALADMPFADEELCPPGALDDDEPDEQLFFEATGNAGASFERSYHRASLVLWPQARKLHVIARGGPEVSLPYLAELSGRWRASGEGSGSPLWEEAHRLARLLIEDPQGWPAPVWPSQADAGKRTRMLDSLTQLQDKENIAAFLADVCARGHYHSDDNDALINASELLPPPLLADLLERIVSRNAPQQAAACANLLGRIAARFAAIEDASTPVALLTAAASALLAALPGDPALAPKPEGWQRPSPVTPALVVDLLTTLYHLDALSMGERAVEQVLAWPETFAVDNILVPAALQLCEAAARDWNPARRLNLACLAHLEKRISESLAPPTDFSRASRIACQCGPCTDLSAFLADPLRKVWRFQAAEAHRRHVEESIRKHTCDVNQETDRRSRPAHTLVCTKNQASYDRRVAQRKKDLQDRELLTRSAAV